MVGKITGTLILFFTPFLIIYFQRDSLPPSISWTMVFTFVEICFCMPLIIRLWVDGKPPVASSKEERKDEGELRE